MLNCRSPSLLLSLSGVIVAIHVALFALDFAELRPVTTGALAVNVKVVSTEPLKCEIKTLSFH